jgi:hypothetical protein
LRRLTGTERTRFQSMPSTSASSCAWFSCTRLLRPRPAERRLLQPLGANAQAGPIPSNDLDPICPPAAEHIERTVERLGTGIPHQANQTVRPLLKSIG